jgi:hypothetical protein
MATWRECTDRFYRSKAAMKVLEAVKINYYAFTNSDITAIAMHIFYTRCNKGHCEYARKAWGYPSPSGLTRVENSDNVWDFNSRHHLLDLWKIAKIRKSTLDRYRPFVRD